VATKYDGFGFVCPTTEPEVQYTPSPAAALAGFTNSELDPVAASSVLWDIADPEAVYIVIVELSIDGLVTRFTDGIPLSTVSIVVTASLATLASRKG
jgi:hypothetical protein